ncbi:hypothetical protein [Spongiactinospora sp. TRM90649]|uniref:hypothetical protein n=1 Tax=Spongiactinospora sp. TRM90649 TaxID=3031114 RepID=UPI0023F9DC9C|nr:hypothetical protein [Spongiactinospora sp. TRM90649]MDF5754235.1 hypothetical protein [Spongiactinospora sp. TRM90649]
MAVTLDDLAADLQSFFADKFPQMGEGTPGSLFLVFDNLGTPLDPAEFATAPFSHQRAAQLADQIPSAGGLARGWYIPSPGKRLSRWYEVMVEGGTAATSAEPGFSAFNMLRAESARSLEENKLIAAAAPGGVEAPGTHDVYYATSMSPADWHAPDSTAWATYALSSQETPPAGAATTPLTVPEWRLRVSDAEQVRRVAAVDDFVGRARMTARPRRFKPPRPSRPGRSGRFVMTAEGDMIPAELEGMETVEEVGDELTTTAPQVVPPPPEPEVVVQETSVAPVATEGFNVSFEYCMVRFERPWWDEVFLLNQGWGVPGHTPGAICGGTATDPKGAITLITAGMIVVRNLVITASWNEDDKAHLTQGISLGPFCVAGADFDVASGALRRPGTQAIAWLCLVPPVLPPVVV